MWIQTQNCEQNKENGSFKVQNWENTNQEDEEQEEAEPSCFTGAS